MYWVVMLLGTAIYAWGVILRYSQDTRVLALVVMFLGGLLAGGAVQEILGISMLSGTGFWFAFGAGVSAVIVGSLTSRGL